MESDMLDRFSSQAIQDLIQKVSGLSIEEEFQNSLVSKLEGAAEALHENNKGQAVNCLNAFISAVRAPRRGIEINNEHADALVVAAEEIIEPLVG